jgi:uncharacterized membrane protein
MKKIGVILLLALLLMSFSLVVALDEPSSPGGLGGDKVDEINEAQEKYSPLDESGKVNFSKYKPFKSKAEERIEGINLWIKDNASWLSVVFGMVPEISWLFAINLYVVLFFFMSLVLNGASLFGFFEVLNKKIDLGFFETSWANILGLGVFVVLLITKFFLNVLVLPSYHFWLLVFEYGWWAIALFWVVLIVLIVFFPRVLRKIRVSMELRKRRRAKEAEEFNREVLEKTVEGISG